ncbi:hypothetical protein SAMN05421543_1232 [Alicyclobacillus macrosporangiidus]|uniref:Uncharacterized protein n=1 Tax=Alicyclobacillus macrosporangiidus TaxID=392015 RepID=A0A1I7L1H3_9BACL|nr:hypothetical protein SAMN05421543_1232 [Alicyclobacillus macrosporangiidus]
MFLYRARVKGTHYIQVCRSERKPGQKPKRKYIASLGPVPKALEEITRALDGEEPIKDVLRQVERTRLLQWKTRLETWQAPVVTNPAGVPALSKTRAPHPVHSDRGGKHVSPDILMYWLQASQAAVGRASTRAPIRIRMFDHGYPIGRWIETQNKVRVEYMRDKPHVHIDGHVYPISDVMVETNMREKPYFVRFTVVCTDGTRIEVIRRSKFKKDLLPEIRRWKLGSEES